MDEAKRFLRYVTPGLAFVVELAALAHLAGIVNVFKLLEGGSESALAAVVTLVAASGGMGYVFGVLHHYLMWRFPWYLRVSTESFLEKLRESGKLKLSRLRENGSESSDVGELTPRGAWRISAVLWKQSVSDTDGNDKNVALDARLDSMTDLMHGVGAAFVGSVVALLILLPWLVGHMWAQFDSRDLDLIALLVAAAPILIAVLLAGVYYYNLRTIARHTQSMSEKVIWNLAKNTPREFVVSIDDTKETKQIKRMRRQRRQHIMDSLMGEIEGQPSVLVNAFTVCCMMYEVTSQERVRQAVMSMMQKLNPQPEGHQETVDSLVKHVREPDKEGFETTWNEAIPPPTADS